MESRTAFAHESRRARFHPGLRVLLGDINLSGRDAQLAALDAHPNIQVRLLNPFKHRRFRSLDFLADMRRVNHRMHNKGMVMDDEIALVGGRNVGADYFEAHDKSNFRDLDIVANGSIVRDDPGAIYDG